MNSDRRKRFRDLVESIMAKAPGGGTDDYVSFVMANDGSLGKFRDVSLWISLEEVVKYILRNRRLERNKAVPAFPSIEIDTGELDIEGNPVRKREYRSMQKMLFDKDTISLDQVVDSYVRRSRSNGRIANAIVKTGRGEIKGYQRELPFPELEDENEDQRAG